MDLSLAKSKFEGDKAAESDDALTNRLVLITCNVLLSTVCVMTLLQLSWAAHDDPTDYYHVLSNYLRFVVSALTFVLLMQILNYFSFARSANPGMYTWSTIAVETILSISHRLPFLDIGEEWELLALIRLYWVLRTVFACSDVHKARHSIRRLMLQSHMADVSDLVFNKIYFRTRPWTVLCWTALASYLLMAYCMHVVERQEQPEVFTPGNALWFSATIISTIGFDNTVYPNTTAGRIFAILGCLLGVFYMSLSALVVINSLSLDGDVELSAYRAALLVLRQSRKRRFTKSVLDNDSRRASFLDPTADDADGTFPNESASALIAGSQQTFDRTSKIIAAR